MRTSRATDPLRPPQTRCACESGRIGWARPSVIPARRCTASLDRALRELVRADRDVGDPARVVDRDVEIVVAALGVPASVVAEDQMTAAGWHPAETLHVDVDQLARSLPDIANRSLGQPICVSETAQAVSAYLSHGVEDECRRGW